MFDDKSKTPFIKQNDGTWCLILLAGKNLVWAMHFDKRHGYSLSVYFEGHTKQNVFSTHQARIWANSVLRDEKECKQIKVIAEILTKASKTIDSMNIAWKQNGCPVNGLEYATMGNA